MRITGFERFLEETEFLVAREREVIALREIGVAARAIGLPFAYLEPSKLRREKGSLLVVPNHSLGYSDQEKTDSNRFLNYVLRLGAEPKSVTVMMHSNDFNVRSRIRKWQHAGFAVIEGAGITKKDSLSRIRDIFSSFEYVLGEELGSYLPYAASVGCKTMVWPECYEGALRGKRPNGDPLHHSDRGFIIENEWIFADFSDAQESRQWGSEAIGADYVLSPTSLIEALGWKPKTIAKQLLERLPRKILREMGFPDSRNWLTIGQ